MLFGHCMKVCWMKSCWAFNSKTSRVLTGYLEGVIVHLCSRNGILGSYGLCFDWVKVCLWQDAHGWQVGEGDLAGYP